MATSTICSVLNVAEFLLGNKSRREPALVTLSDEYSYGDLQDASRAVAGYLDSIGGRRGDRVLLVSDNSFFCAATYLGTLYAGLVCVPMPAATTNSEFQYALQTTEAIAAFLQVSAARGYSDLPVGFSVVLEKSVSKISDIQASSFPDLLTRFRDSQVTPAEVEAHDLAALMFTSGSTGTPRAVMVSHENIIANTESIIDYLQLTQDDRIMAVLPFHYCFGASLLHTHLRVGGSVVIENRFLYPEAVLQRMVETQCTGFAGVPSHFQILLKSSGLRTKTFPQLRYVQQAGGNLPAASISELQQALPGTKVFVMYGQTEATARLSYLPPDYLSEKLGSIGKGLTGVSLRVVGETGLDVAPGENGELVAEGKNITLGYWRDPQETAATFREGKLYTGDIATVDKDGFIYIVDRAKDFLKCGGKRIGCRQIEQQLLEFPNVLEVAVIGVPDPILGEAVKVFVVPRNPSPDFEGLLQAFCRQRLLPQFVPRSLVVLDFLPKSESGKVSKQALKRL